MGQHHVEEFTKTAHVAFPGTEKKTVPVECPWCGKISRTAKLNVGNREKISPVHWICTKCLDFIRKVEKIDGDFNLERF